jgi:hypothetical protein
MGFIHKNVLFKWSGILFFFFSLFSSCRSSGGLPVNATRDSREKPSEMIAKENKYWLSKGTRAAKREMRRRKRHYRMYGTYSD